MSNIFQMKIMLRESAPPIWRRFLVKDNLTFHKLHEILQVVMGWTNSHLYDFQIKEQRITFPLQDWDEKVINSKKVKINTLQEKQKFDYTYDFGDCWEHTIVVEKILYGQTGLPPPICLKGSLSCPPEDCGGIGGYYHLLQIKNNKSHPEYKERGEWLGKDFNPELFDHNVINKELMERFIDRRARFWVPPSESHQNAKR